MTAHLPIYDQVLAELGPLPEPLTTEWTVLESWAVCALVERQP